MDVHDIVLEALRTREIDQAALARQLGRSQATVSRWVSGKASPDYDSCLRLAQITGIPAHRVLELAGLDARYVPPEHANALPLDPEEAEFLAIIRQLARPQRPTVKAMLLGLVRPNSDYGALEAA